MTSLILKASVAIGVSLLLTACTGGGSGGGSGGAATGQVVTVTGDVSTPNGLIASVAPEQNKSWLFTWFGSLGVWPQDAYAQSVGSLPGTTLVQQYEAFLVSVAPGGEIQEMVARQTVTGGSFSFSIDPDTASTASLVVQAAPLGTAAPVSIGSPGVINAPAVGTAIHLDPSTETATRQLAAGQRLGFLRANQTTAYVELIRQFVQEDPTVLGSTVAASVQNITSAPKFVTDVQPVLAEIIQAPPTPNVSGSYGFVFIFTRLDSAQGSLLAPAMVVREIGDGTITFDPKAGTFDLTGDSIAIVQSDLGICLPKSVPNPGNVGDVFTISGFYVFTDTKKLILTITKSSDKFDRGTRHFYMNQDATVGIGGNIQIVREFFDGSYSIEPGTTQLGILVKQEPEPTPPSGSYHAVTLESVLKQIPPNFGLTPLLERQQSIQTGVGELTIGGLFNLNPAKLISTVVCDQPTLPPLPGTPANLNNVNVTQTFPALGVRGSFGRRHFSGNGIIGLMANPRPDPLLPLLSQNYPMFQPGLGILGRQSAGMNTSNLSGTFKVLSLSFQEGVGWTAGNTTQPPGGGTTSPLIFETVIFSDGILNFNGAGSVAVSTVASTMSGLAYVCSWPINNLGGLGACDTDRRLVVGWQDGLPLNSYSVSPSGQLDLGSSIGSLTKGFLSPDGTFFATVGGKEPPGSPSADRRIIVGVKQ